MAAANETKIWRLYDQNDVQGIVKTMQECNTDVIILSEACNALSSLALSADREALKDLATTKSAKAIVKALTDHVGGVPDPCLLPEEEEEEKPAEPAPEEEAPAEEEEEEDAPAEEEPEDSDHDKEGEEGEEEEPEKDEEEVETPFERAEREKAEELRLLNIENAEKLMEERRIELQKNGFNALTSLARFAGEDVRAQVVDAGAAKTVMNTMDSHVRNHGLQAAAMEALGMLVRWRPKLARRCPRPPPPGPKLPPILVAKQKAEEEEAKLAALKAAGNIPGGGRRKKADDDELPKVDHGSDCFAGATALIIRAVDPHHGDDDLTIKRRERYHEKAEAKGCPIPPDPVPLETVRNAAHVALLEFVKFGTNELKSEIRLAIEAESMRTGKQPSALGGKAADILAEELQAFNDEAERLIKEEAKEKKRLKEIEKEKMGDDYVESDEEEEEET